MSTIAAETTFTVMGTLSEMGRTRTLLRCNRCHHEQIVYVWSWAGHGFVRCKGCRVEHRYLLVDWSGPRASAPIPY